MLHMVIRWFTDSSLVDLPRSSRALPVEHSDIDSNGSVKQFMAVDLPAFPTETSGRDRQISSAVLLSDTRSGESCGGLSRSNDSNMVCEAIRADVFVKHIIDQDCQHMGKSSTRPFTLSSNSTCFSPWLQTRGGS